MTSVKTTSTTPQKNNPENFKLLRVKQSSEFKKIGNKGRKFYAKTLLLLSHPSPQRYFCDQEKGQNATDFCRVGFTVSKKIGNAVARNYAKRRLKEAFARLFAEYAMNKRDYVVIARKEIADADFKKILSDLKFCLKRIDANQGSPKK